MVAEMKTEHRLHYRFIISDHKELLLKCHRKLSYLASLMVHKGSQKITILSDEEFSEENQRAKE